MRSVSEWRGSQVCGGTGRGSQRHPAQSRVSENSARAKMRKPGAQDTPFRSLFFTSLAHASSFMNKRKENGDFFSPFTQISVSLSEFSRLNDVDKNCHHLESMQLSLDSRAEVGKLVQSRPTQ